MHNFILLQPNASTVLEDGFLCIEISIHADAILFYEIDNGFPDWTPHKSNNSNRLLLTDHNHKTVFLAFQAVSIYILLGFFPFHIIFIAASASRMVRIIDLVPSASTNINTEFILLDKGMPTIEGPEKVCLALVADETAAVHFQFWGGECDAFERGDIIRLTKGIFSFIKGKLLLRAGRRGKVEKIGEFTMLFVETPNLSEITWNPDAADPTRYVQGAVLSPHSRLFPPLP